MAKNRKRRRHAGEGTVYQRRADGLWIAEVSVGPRGRRKRVTGSGRTPEDAIRDRDRKRRRLGGVPATPKAQTVAHFLEWWLDVELVARVQDPGDLFQQTTLNDYRSKVDNCIAPLVGHLRVDRLSAQDVTGMLRALSTRASQRGDPYSPSTVRHALRVLSSALDCALQLGVVDDNAAKKVRVPHVPASKPRPLEVDEARAVLAAAGHDAHRFYEPLWRVSLGVGCRPGEATALTWSDVDLERRELTVRRNMVRHGGRLWVHDTKAHRVRVVPLPGFAVDALRFHRRAQDEQRARAGDGWVDEDIRPTGGGGSVGGGLVFRQPDGRAVRYEWMNDELKRICVRAGVPALTPHKFIRHGCATLLLALGEDLSTIREILGHTSVAVTEIYAHVVDSSMRGAADRLDEALG